MRLKSKGIYNAYLLDGATPFCTGVVAPCAPRLSVNAEHARIGLGAVVDVVTSFAGGETVIKSVRQNTMIFGVGISSCICVGWCG